MNATGLNIIKTLGCMTAVTFFTIYNTRDHYDYDYHWILGFLPSFRPSPRRCFLWLQDIWMGNPDTARAGSWIRSKAR